MRFTIHTQIATAIALVAITAPAWGASLFTDDFESYSPNSTLGTSGPWGYANGPNGYRTVRDENTAVPFGTPNQYADLNDTGSSSSSPAEYIRLQSPDIAAAASAVTTLSLDIYEPSTGGGDSIGIGYARSGADLNSSGTRVSINLNDGVISGLSASAANTYSLDTAYTLYLIFNDTASPFAYDGGTIAAGTADVWIEALGSGTPVFVGTSATSNPADTAYQVSFRVFNGPQQQLLVDNVSVDAGAAITVIPEPASLASGLFGLALCLARRRRA